MYTISHSVEQAKNYWDSIYRLSSEQTPFSSFEYTNIFSNHFVPDINSIRIILLKDTLLAAFEIVEKKAVLLGMKPVLENQEITDFADILISQKTQLQEHIAPIHKLLKKEGANTIQYDYIRQDSSLYQSLRKLNFSFKQQEVSPSIVLPGTWNDYIDSLERTNRKELKRKIKRFSSLRSSFSVSSTISQSDFETFIHLHRLSDPEKNKFMTEQMKSFFSDLVSLTIPNWTIHLAFLTIDTKPAASVLFFENSETILLYNSGYDPSFHYYSVGLILKTHLIQYAIERKIKKFDFLRGGERYKYDLGAKDIHLYQAVVQV